MLRLFFVCVYLIFLECDKFEIDNIFLKLSNSRFRSKFYLRSRERRIIFDKGLDGIEKDTYQILDKRIRKLASNDGRQTPWNGHPVFVAQHGTAICCRGCMEKWYGVGRDIVLSERELWFFVDLIMEWIVRKL